MVALWIIIGFIIGFASVVFALKPLSKRMTLVKTNYILQLKNEDGTVAKDLSSFTKFYWNTKSSENDIRILMDYCDDIRMNIVYEDNYLADMIDENFVIDNTKIFLRHESSNIKPI